MPREVGYAHLHAVLNLPLPPPPAARVQPVLRLMDSEAGGLAVPAAVAPAGDDPIAHLLFALKHEGTNLQVLSAALRRLPAAGLLAEVKSRPAGRYARIAACLWERFNGERLPDLPVSGATAPLFDPRRYFTGPGERDPRWRVLLNPLGNLSWSATVRRTAAIEQQLAHDVLGQARSFADEAGPVLLDRALAWAYLSETESSFAIEREAPGQDRAARFASLLRLAGQGADLSEVRFVQWQNATIANPFEQAQQFRTEQNWLRGPGPGALAVTYVPPPPALALELMERLMQWANESGQSLPPLVQAAVVSFGFVFLHPFMDGNGRLSRYLVHHVLGRSGQLPAGFVLPISVAMKRNEAGYLAALQAFSRPAREWWDVRWIDEGQYALQFCGDEALYRHWDATAAVDFLLHMAREALQQDLQAETQFLHAYDRAQKAVEARFDLRSNALATLLRSAFQNRGQVSLNRRKQFADLVPEAAFDFIEQTVQAELPDLPLRPSP